ncbi:MAG: hypothetical protein ACI9JN_000748 [Bacteroidia bacterium]|jgi:hypothetical protein
MGHFILKYLFVIGVVLMGFQHSAYADEKDKDKHKDKTTITKKDTIKIKVNLDIQADDTLVFDDFDEDDDDDKGDNSSIALSIVQTKVTVCIIPRQNPEILLISCGYILPHKIDSSATPSPISAQTEQPLESNLYPNPASSDQSVWVTHNITDEVTITVYTMSGQVIKTLSTVDQKIKLPGLSTGMYLVHISGNGASESKRLLVQ